jgi:hypothetical protein
MQQLLIAVLGLDPRTGHPRARPENPAIHASDQLTAWPAPAGGARATFGPRATVWGTVPGLGPEDDPGAHVPCRVRADTSIAGSSLAMTLGGSSCRSGLQLYVSIGAVRLDPGMTGCGSGSMARFGSPVRSRDVNSALTSCGDNIRRVVHATLGIRTRDSRDGAAADSYVRMDHPIGPGYAPLVAERLTGPPWVEPGSDDRNRPLMPDH